jgi:mannose-6-phosphate isomerase
MMEKRLLERLKHQFIKPAPNNLVELVWGGDYIEKLKGLPPSGRKIGESWECSAHPQHPSKVIINSFEIPLPQILLSMGEEILGTEIAEKFSNRLPILVKFIDAREDLSVQVHPSDEKARELGEADSGKNEAWLILEADEGAVLYLGFKQDVDKEEFENDLSSSTINIADKYLNAIPVKRGEVFFNPAGTIHTIGKGIVLIEIQQSSGITYRVWDWNRTPKRPLHIEKALEVLDFSQKTESDFRQIPRRLSDNEERLIDSRYFSVDRITLNPGAEISLNTRGGFQVLSCLEGAIKLQSQNSQEELSRGQSLLVPATISQYKMAATDFAIVLKSFLPQFRSAPPTR